MTSRPLSERVLFGMVHAISKWCPAIAGVVKACGRTRDASVISRVCPKQNALPFLGMNLNSIWLLGQAFMAMPNNHQGDWRALECALVLDQPSRKEETANTTEFCSFCTLVGHLFPFSQIDHKGNKNPSIK